MKKILFLTFTFLFVATPSWAQRSNKVVSSFTEYRSLGEVKGWSFVAKDSAIGQLFSTVKQKVTFAGEQAYEIDQNLQLDYNKIGTERLLEFRGNHYVGEQGYYLGDKLEISINKESEKLELERNGGLIKGFYTRSGNEIESEIEYKANGYAADIMYLDMFENFFAHQNFAVGDTVVDSIFVPQTMLVERISAIIESFGLVTLYNQVKDSVFVIRLSQPQSMLIYFNLKRQLVKADYLSRQMKAYLDVVQSLPTAALTKPQFSFSKFRGLVPLYSLYLFFGVVALLFFAGADVHRLNLYLFLIAGGASFIVASFTQIPLQTYLGNSVFMPNVSGGGSPFFWAIIPAIPAGLIQEFLKLAVIISVTKFVKIDRKKLLLYGAAIGAGFGIIEAAYIVSQIPAMEFWSMNLVERAFQILFHTASGVILAAVVQTGAPKKRALYLVIVILVNAWIRYIPVFAQGNVLKPDLLYLLQPVAPLVLIIYCVNIFKQEKSGG